MKKLKIDLNGIGELLSKEQMKMVTGGDGYTAAYVLCTYNYWLPNGDKPSISEGYYNINYGNNCEYFCTYASSHRNDDYFSYVSCQVLV